MEKLHNNILGYELINEPWVGDVFKFPELYTPKMCDIINLRNLYEYLNNIIRSIDYVMILIIYNGKGD